MRIDYHVHTYYSDDSKYPMEEVVKDAIQLKIDEICFTDHVDYGIKNDVHDPVKTPCQNVDYEKYFKEHIGHRFISFLKINDALDAYIYNLKEQLNETLLERILFVSPDYYIDSFGWEGTKQGFEYWSNLDEAWDCIITLERNAKRFNQEYYEQIKKIINKYEA